MKHIKNLILAACLLALQGVAAAATASSTLAVTATVSSACIVSTSPVAFGAYNPTAPGALNSTGTVSVTCTNGTNYDITLDGGVHANVSAREMDSGVNRLAYQLYSDASRTTIWGTSTPVSGTATGSQIDHTVYGQVPAGQAAPAGSYVDTVNVAVTYN